ncbi:MAG: head decoration protein [Aquabacterium sp.]
MSSFIEALPNQEIHADALVGKTPVVSGAITLEGTEALPRGAVLGVISATGRYRLATANADDGSSIPCAVLAIPANPTGGAVAAWAYFNGSFKAAALSFDSSYTLPLLIEAMHKARLLILG